MYGVMQSKLKKTPLHFMLCVFECADQEYWTLFWQGATIVIVGLLVSHKCKSHNKP